MSFSIRMTDRRAVASWVDIAMAALVLAASLMILSTTSPAVRAATLAARHDVPAGTIVISQRERRLYLALDEQGTALSYPVAVGRAGHQWQGRAEVDGKYVDPAWSPPAVVRRAEPWLPAVIPGGAPNNPMGHRALTLTGGEYAIHGTNRPWTIGTAASYGCIRMREADIEDLFERVSVGTPVVMEP